MTTTVDSNSTTQPAHHSGLFRIGGDLPVVRLGYGAMRLTGPGIWGPPADHDEALAVLRRAVELGVTLIDTADSYGPYVSEELIHEALHPYPQGLVIATKAGQVRTGPGEWHPLGRPEFLRQEAEMSLRRLGLDRIDLFQLHRVDPLVPLEDQVPDGNWRPGSPWRTFSRDCDETGSHTSTTRASMVATALAGSAADPWYVVGRAP